MTVVASAQWDHDPSFNRQAVCTVCNVLSIGVPAEASHTTAHPLLDTEPADFASAFRTTSERTAAYAHIAHELDILDTQARVWKRRHNSLSFSCRLPVEILSRIFLFVIEAENGMEEAYAWDLRWIPRISHICSHWRQVALENPQLWTGILTEYRKWVPEMLRRSKAALLTMDAYLSMDTLLKNLHRVRHLTIHVEQKDEAHLSALDNAPFLETCSVYADSEMYCIHIPDDFLNHAPQVHTLSLSSCWISHASPLLSDHLTSLELMFLGSFMHSVPLILNQTPNLHTLKLLGNLDCIDSMPSHNFPHLRHLVLGDRDWAVNILQFFKCFRYPKGVSVTAYLWPDETQYHSAVFALSELGRLAGDRMDPVLCFKAFNSRTTNWVTIRVWDSVQLGSDGVQLLRSPPEARPQLEVHMNSNNPQLASRTRRVEAILALYNGLPTQNMHSLFLDGLKMTSSQWLKHFGSLPSLSNLHVDHYGRGLVRALSTQIGGLWSFRSLQYLAVKNWGVDGEVLANCLAERKKEGFTLLKLRLMSNLHVRSDGKALLRNSVVEIESDGILDALDRQDNQDPGQDGSGYNSDTTASEDSNADEDSNNDGVYDDDEDNEEEDEEGWGSSI